MKKLLVLIPAAAFVVLTVPAPAGVAPNAPNSALAQSGAKIAPPARQSTADKAAEKEHHDSVLKDSTK